MKPVRVVVGTMLPIERSDIDTDQIIPASWLQRIERAGFGAGLFANWRTDPEFPLDRPEHAGASILVAGPNFGIGSSREHAVWALVDAGFAAVVSPRIADIFKANAIRSGLVPVEVSEAFASRCLAAASATPGARCVVDLATSTISLPELGCTEPFELAQHARSRLMEGIDDVAATLGSLAAIERYEAGRAARLPKLTRS
jgi:3-isopropylmalate/(R)-2-methylmalate dehydratase small subunit